MGAIKVFLKEVVLPIALAFCLALFLKPIYMPDGVCDYFLMWICVGLPFGIRRMCLWLVPSGYGISGSVGIFALNLIIFLYIRVACADQLAAASQREELERYAKDKGYEVAAAVAADGISGVHTEGIMNFLLNEAKRQDIGTILTRDTSRISRDTSSFMRFERKFRENGIRFEYLSKPDNELPVTPMMEAFEAAYKKRRTKNGKRA